MRKAVLAFALTVLLAPQSFAGVWEAQCAGCHNGSLAPSKAQLKAKFKTAKAFVEAGKKSPNPMMAPFKSNIKALKDAAKELYR